MKNKLYIIGNGFDLAHNLPTRFDPDFKNITSKYEFENFWELFQSDENDIWSDFENLLGCPDFNLLEEIFEGCYPDYSSDKESERDGIIAQVISNGKLYEALYEFANKAENIVHTVHKNEFLKNLLDVDGFYINFNYTHTLEKIYAIPKEQILHIHGEVGKNNLQLGYPEGNFSPKKYYYDPRKKGRGPFIEIDIEKYIDNIEDYYVHEAYSNLLYKCKSFKKKIRNDLKCNL